MLLRPFYLEADKINMISKHNFELQLEHVAEKFYFNAASAMVSPRGGNSRGNEVYFGNVSTDLRTKLRCQQILLPKGECPDSGIFGSFNYLSESEVDWEAIKSGRYVCFEVSAPNNQKRYIEIESIKLNLLNEIIKSDSNLVFNLNELKEFGELFGVEFKASKNDNPNSIAVASFNSSCPSGTKTTELSKIKMIHNLATNMRKKFNNSDDLKVCEVKLKIRFSMYYFIVNDVENGTRSEIKHILICRGTFFSSETSEEEAARLSKQIMPSDLGLNLNLHRVKLRYRPFFESRSIKANGYGLYTSWEPKIALAEEVESQRRLLLEEVEKIQQELEESDLRSQVVDREETDNVIYLNLKEERIRLRSVA